MFVRSQGPIPGMDFAFPDVCLTPVVVPVPIPYPNIALSSAAVPTVTNMFIMGMPAQNLMTMGATSLGDMAGGQRRRRFRNDCRSFAPRHGVVQVLHQRRTGDQDAGSHRAERNGAQRSGRCAVAVPDQDVVSELRCDAAAFNGRPAPVATDWNGLG